MLVKEPFVQYATVWFSYEPKSVPTTVVDATLQRQHPATVTWWSTPEQIVQTYTNGGSFVWAFSTDVLHYSMLRMCVLTSLYCYGRGAFISNNTFRQSSLVLLWSYSSCVRAVVNVFIATEFMLAETTCFNFRQAYHNHRLSLDQLNALCGSWCCQFWRKDIISMWTIITPPFHCLPHFLMAHCRNKCKKLTSLKLRVRTTW